MNHFSRATGREVTLAAFERRWVEAIFTAIFPGPSGAEARPDGEGGTFSHGVDAMGPASFFEATLARAPLEAALGLRLTVWLVALAPIFLFRRPATIAALGPRDRERALDRLLSSPVYPVRQLTAGLKAIASLLYAQSPAIRREMTTPKRPGEATGSDRGRRPLVMLKKSEERATAHGSNARRGDAHAAE